MAAGGRCLTADAPSGGHCCRDGWVSQIDSQQDLTLDVSCDIFDLHAVKGALAELHGVDESLVTLTNPCIARRARALQSLTLTMTIAASGTTASGTPVSAPPIDDLLSALSEVDDAALGASLGAALGTTISVTSTAAESSTTTRMVAAICPRGSW